MLIVPVLSRYSDSSEGDWTSSQRSHVADLLSLERAKYFHAREGVAGGIFFKMFSERTINLF